MVFLPARKILVLLVLGSLFFLFASPVLALDLGVGTSTTSGWVQDNVVTEVGKNAERARQFLYWVFSHPSLDNTPVLAQIWSFSRNIVYILFLLILVAAGFSFMLAQRRGLGPTFSGIGPFNFQISLPRFLVKIVALLAFVTLSYVIVLGLIQGAELLMRFFIEKVGGKDLFNIFFAGTNTEANYTTFVGFRDSNPLNNEAANTSLFLIRLTSLTYNIMALILILRKIILWFLLIVSPFLALLLPFVFIRNIGWLWIGTFLQWLFYGPLVALFLGGLARIWGASAPTATPPVSGIPYPFDFSGVGDKVVYPTAINILWGGPGQVLSPTNSGNYVDTYAEYVIALVMLWAVMFLPWLLLRIFRDYCCDVFQAAQATMVAVYDRLRGIAPPPPPPPAPAEALRFELPFRKAITIPVKISLEKLADVSRAQTREIAQALGMSISSIREVAEFEINREKQRTTQQKLDYLREPQKVVSLTEREKFQNVRQEILTRASQGDRLAQQILAASEKRPEQVLQVIPMVVTPAARVPVTKKPGMPRVIPMVVPTKAPPVTVEDYEEVKKMWVGHYRQGEIPVSEKIKTRKDWVALDITKLTNTLDLLQSFEPSQKKKGLEEVSATLPFLLLGGFSEEETKTYLKAKLEAAKQVEEEMVKTEEIKAEVKKEEEVVEVPVKAKTEEKVKTAEMKEEKAINEEKPPS